MGYVNKDRRIVNITSTEKKAVNRKRRRALQRELHGEHMRSALRAVRRGWWYA